MTAGRRTGAPDTRGEIIAAARSEFASKGFQQTSMRGVARAAGVDPALIHHYFDGKDGLFVAAMEFPVSPSERLTDALDDVPRAEVGGTILRTMLGVWDDPEFRPALVAALRSLVSGDDAGDFLGKGLLEGMIVPALRDAVDGGVSPRGAGLMATQMAGLVIARYLLGAEPIASMDREELAVLIGPTLQRYLDL